MANVPTNAFGFRPLGFNRGGGPQTGGQIERPIVASYATNICYGDIVQIGGGGGNPDTTAGYVRRGAVSVTGSLQLGVFVGCQYIDASGNTRQSSYWPASNPNAGVAKIVPIAGSPVQFFAVAGGDSSGTTSFTIADVGYNCDFALGTQSINGGYGLSGSYLDRNTINYTATLPFRIEGLLTDISASGQSGISNIILVSSNPFNATGA